MRHDVVAHGFRVAVIKPLLSVRVLASVLLRLETEARFADSQLTLISVLVQLVGPTTWNT